MKSRNHHNGARESKTPLRQHQTARFGLPVNHPPLWRFVLDQVLTPATRMHRYRNLSARMTEDTLNELDRRYCR